MHKCPWFINIIITSDPANFQYLTATNYRNYELKRFRVQGEIFDILADGSIFNCDSKLWDLN